MKHLPITEIEFFDFPSKKLQKKERPLLTAFFMVIFIVLFTVLILSL